MCRSACSRHIRGDLLDIEGKPFQEGDRVTFLDVHRTCHRCYHCLVAKASTRCPDRKVYGITYGLETGLTGGWAQYIHMLPGTICIRMNDVPSDLYMAGGCSLPTSLHAAERADIRIGDSVLVLGAGPVGLSTGAFARMRGALKVMTIGAPNARLETAKAMGADEAINHEGRSESELIDWVKSHTGGRGSDVTIECTGNPIAVTLGYEVHTRRWSGRGLSGSTRIAAIRQSTRTWTSTRSTWTSVVAGAVITTTSTAACRS